MSVIHKATISVNRGTGSTITRQSTSTGEGETYIPAIPCPDSANTNIEFATPTASIKSILIYADGPVILRTNNAAPGANSFNLTADNAVFWNDEMLTANPFTTDITSLWAVNGTAQVETNTVVGTIGASGAGNATVIITAAGMTGSPKTISVAVANNDTAAQVAGKIRTALGLDAAVTALFTVGGSSADVSLTRLLRVANDATLNISINNGTCTGLTPELVSTNTTLGVASAGASVALTILVALDVTP